MANFLSERRDSSVSVDFYDIANEIIKITHKSEVVTAPLETDLQENTDELTLSGQAQTQD